MLGEGKTEREEKQRVDVNKSACVCVRARAGAVTETFPLHLHPQATRLFVFVVSSLLRGRGSWARGRCGLKGEIRPFSWRPKPIFPLRDHDQCCD